MTQPRVFIPQEPVRWDASVGAQVPLMDFTPALRYGELITCLPPNVSFHMTKPVTAALKEKMASFTEDDYLIAAGSPMVIAISAGIALRKTGGKLNLLSWDKRERQYLATRIEL
jgi:hypothetical protein